MEKCKGEFIPKYEIIKHERWDIIEQKYKYETIPKEIDSICSDCKQSVCKDDYAPRKE